MVSGRRLATEASEVIELERSPNDLKIDPFALPLEILGDLIEIFFLIWSKNVAEVLDSFCI